MIDIEEARRMHRPVGAFRPLGPSEPRPPYCDTCGTFWPCPGWRMLTELEESRGTITALREQLRNEREAGLSAYEACGLRGAYWHVVEMLGRRDEELEAALAECRTRGIELEHARNAGPPGLWVCPRCAFVCMRSNLNARDGSITVNLDEPEPCPNDGEMLRRVTWREHAQDMAARATEQMEHAEQVQAQLDRVTAEWGQAQAKGRAFDRVRDALAEFGDTEHIGGVLSERLGTWEHEHPEDATLGQLIDGLAFHGCVTGDCPDEHTPRDCAAALVAAIDEFAADARSKLRAAAPGGAMTAAAKETA